MITQNGVQDTLKRTKTTTYWTDLTYCSRLGDGNCRVSVPGRVADRRVVAVLLLHARVSGLTVQLTGFWVAWAHL